MIKFRIPQLSIISYSFIQISIISLLFIFAVCNCETTFEVTDRSDLISTFSYIPPTITSTTEERAKGISSDLTATSLSTSIPTTFHLFYNKVDRLFNFPKDYHLVLVAIVTIATITLTTSHFLQSSPNSGSSSASSLGSVDSLDTDNTSTSTSSRRKSFKNGFNSLLEGMSGIGSRVNSATKSVFNGSSYGTYGVNSNDPKFQFMVKRAAFLGGNVGGLYNDGNTCFMNSVLQSLASSNEFMDFLNEYTTDESGSTKEIKGSKVPFSIALNTLLSKLNAKHGNRSATYKTKGLLKVMSNAPNKNLFLGYQQEDAQEFYQSVMKQVEKEYSSATLQDGESSSSKKKTDQEKFVTYEPEMLQGLDKLGEIGNIYVPAIQVDPSYPGAESQVLPLKLITPVDGLQCERIGCMNCGEIGGIRYSVISGLGLSLPPNNKPSHELTELLDDWIRPEVIDGVECNRCGLTEMLNKLKAQVEEYKSSENHQNEKIQKLIDLTTVRINEIEHELNKPVINDDIYKKMHTKNVVQKSRKTKQIYFARPPPLLCIHINRSVFDPRTYTVRKNNSTVLFPLHLNLTDYVAEPEYINMDARYPFRVQDFVPELDQQEEQQLTTDPDFTESEVTLVDKKSENKNTSVVDSENMDVNEEQEEDSEEVEDNEKLEKPKEETPIKEKIINNELTYSLKSVISHFGTHNYGHYIAYRKYRGVWWRISDETVRVTNEREVLNCQGTFMLFYELSHRNDPRDDYIDSNLSNASEPIDIVTGDPDSDAIVEEDGDYEEEEDDDDEEEEDADDELGRVELIPDADDDSDSSMDLDLDAHEVKNEAMTEVDALDYEALRSQEEMVNIQANL